MEVNITGLKCDHCDYRDDSIPFEKYKENIGRLCPKCRHSILSQKEYDDCLKIYEGVSILNKIGNTLKWVNPFHYYRLVFGDKRKYVSVELEYKNKKNIN